MSLLDSDLTLFSPLEGLTKMCNQPVGLQHPKIAKRALTASSEWNKNHNAALGRLHNKRHGRFMGAWSAKRNDRNQWLQVDLRGPTRVTKITTQGRQDANQWVRSYRVHYSENGRAFALLRSGNRPKVLACELFIACKLLLVCHETCPFNHSVHVLHNSCLDIKTTKAPS